jgi:hypothetical protein
MRPTILISLVALACTHDRSPVGGRQPAESATSTRRSVPDSMAVHADGPTLIAFSPVVTQAQVDSSEDLATVLDDFAYYLGAAQDSLHALGFKIVDVPYGTIHLFDKSGSRNITPARDSADVGYVFVAPGRPDRVFYGVMTNMDLAEAGHRFLTPADERNLDRRSK